jgi:hypothetical protein
LFVPFSSRGYLAIVLLLRFGVSLATCAGGSVWAQPFAFAGNAQHTAIYDVPAQPLNAIHWSAPIDLDYNAGALGHYGAPIISSGNTLIASVRITNGFQVTAFDATTGRFKYTLTTDFITPPYGAKGWFPVYQPVIANPPSGPRLYYAGAGGTLYYIEDIDSDNPSTTIQQCFYTNLAAYAANAGGSNGFNNTLFINTPITADSNGVIFFGFRVQQTVPAPLNTTNDGFARIDAAGNGSYVLAGLAAGDSTVFQDSHNCAPALSSDGGTLYVPVKGSNNAYLLGLDSLTLATKFRALLLDPSSGLPALVSDMSTASPLVGPDGDVFFGVVGNPIFNYHGFLLHFSADLRTGKTPGAFGWDNTACIVPTNMVPSYGGPSPYLLFSKYNNYGGSSGDGVNRVALLDPNAAENVPALMYSGLPFMREVLTAIGPTPDRMYETPPHNLPYAVREWCVNTAAVNPASQSVFAPSEDGHLYCWNLASNSLSQALPLTTGVGEAYVPTLVGPDGTVFTINGGTLFAVGGLTNLGLSIYSSAPDLRTFLAGQPVTFTAVVTNLSGSGPAPTGTITFEEQTWNGLTPVTNALAAGIPLTNGVASLTITNLGSNSLGNYFITAAYSGDSLFAPGSATLVQKVHSHSTVSMLTAAAQTSNTLIITATVGSNSPSGQITFWDGSTVIGQVPLKQRQLSALATCSWTDSNYIAGSHSLSATYVSDTVNAASTGAIVPTLPMLTGLSLQVSNAYLLSFSNVIGAPFTVYGSTDITAPFIDWSILGPATEISPGDYKFSDSSAMHAPQKFYRVRSP